jgi:hypothetical protein
MTERLRCADPDAEVHINALVQRLLKYEARLRAVEKPLDTRRSPLWRRVLWRLDGFKSWPWVERRRSRRPWHPPSQGRRADDK